jgi:hypothetical protein
LSRFIETRITSLEDLQVLLFLQRHGDKWWSAGEIASALGVSPVDALAALERMSGDFFAVRMTNDVCFRFGPTNPEREALVSALAEAYKTQRNELIQLITGRSQAVKDFADAFRLHREK